MTCFTMCYDLLCNWCHMVWHTMTCHQSIKCIINSKSADLNWGYCGISSTLIFNIRSYSGSNRFLQTWNVHPPIATSFGQLEGCLLMQTTNWLCTSLPQKIFFHYLIEMPPIHVKEIWPNNIISTSLNYIRPTPYLFKINPNDYI